jgi:hypothetical protein
VCGRIFQRFVSSYLRTLFYDEMPKNEVNDRTWSSHSTTPAEDIPSSDTALPALRTWRAATRLVASYN